MQKNCTNAKSLLSAYIDGQLSEEEKMFVCEHLNLCDDCRQEYEFLSGIVTSAQTMPTLSVSGDLHTHIMQSVTQAAREQAVPKTTRRSLWQMASGFAVAAAVIAISVVSFGSLPGHPDLTAEPTPKAETKIIVEAPPNVSKPNVEQKNEVPISRQTLPESSVREVKPAPSEPAESAVPAAETPIEPVETATLVEPVALAEEPLESRESIHDSSATSSSAKSVDGITCYYIADASYEDAVLILDAYEFDGIAYLIPQSEKDVVYTQLQSLSGYVGHTEEGEQTDYIRIALASE